MLPLSPFVPFGSSFHWPFTGGCHYSDSCQAYITGCESCPVLNSSTVKDVSWRIFRRKKAAYKDLDDLTVIGLSQWLADLAKSSKLFKNKNVICLPNPINTQLFKPNDKKASRELWNLPSDKKLILFGAMSATSDKRKGFNELLKALKHVNSSNVELIVFGSSRPKEDQNFGFKTHYLGQLYDKVSLISIYNSADVMITPSLQENLSNVVMESLSCGTPVVGFNVGGNKDMINHKENGYLAELANVKDLAEGIDWVLQHDNYNEICRNGRQKIINSFESNLVAEKYLNLYQNLKHNDNNQ